MGNELRRVIRDDALPEPQREAGAVRMEDDAARACGAIHRLKIADVLGGDEAADVGGDRVVPTRRRHVESRFQALAADHRRVWRGVARKGPELSVCGGAEEHERDRIETSLFQHFRSPLDRSTTDERRQKLGRARCYRTAAPIAITFWTQMGAPIKKKRAGGHPARSYSNLE